MTEPTVPETAIAQIERAAVGAKQRRERERESVSTTDYPVASPPDIAPPIYRAMIICSMALQYLQAIAPSSVDFSLDEAFDAAHATWDTEWPDDPEPRTIEASRDVVSDDLAYWAEG